MRVAISSSHTVAVLTGGLALLVVADALAVLTLLVVLIVLGFAAYVFLQRQLGGFTGDALGAVQQVGELSIYLSLLALSGVAL